MSKELTLAIVIGVPVFTLLASTLWWVAFNWPRWLMDLECWIGNHKPDRSRAFDGCSEHSKCRFCRREVMRDSQGNWFTFKEDAGAL